MPVYVDAYFEHAQLSMAAYAALTEGIPSDAYKEALKNEGFSDVQATAFVSTYSVAKVFSDPATNFSATLFQKRGSAEKILAIRGTESWQDIMISDLQIGLFGLANQYQSLRNFLPQIIAQIPPSDTLTVAGHSLGGFLAQIFTLDNQNLVSGTYTTNTPGLGGILFNPLGLFGIAGEMVPNSLITNLIAQGFSFVASQGRQFGTATSVFIEQSPNPLDNHGKMSITDALALYSVFATVDPTLHASAITNVLTASSQMNERRLESSLDALRRAFQGADIPSTPISSALNEDGSSEARNIFYGNLFSVRDSVASSTVGSSRIVSLVGEHESIILSRAKSVTPDGLAYRYALRELNPFVIVGIDYETLHNQDHSLDIYDPSTGTIVWTQMALSDRAELLAEKLRFNVNDGTPSSSTLFVDETTNFNNQRGATAAEVVIFGDAEGREYLGRRGNDHVYGGAGDDFVHGAGGQDYLEGNDGNDELYGEADNDILLGQLGNDKLDGGTGIDRMNGGAGDDIYIVDNSGDTVVEMENGGRDEVLASASFTLGAHVEKLTLTGMGNTAGTGNNLDNRITGNAGNNRLAGLGGNDFLEGGLGFDTYIYHSGDGMDQIEDSDAQGQIIFDDRLLQGGIRRAGGTPNTYTSLDGKTTYVMSGTDLIVNGVLIVNENSQSGQMGIQLRDVSEMPRDTGIPTGSFRDTYIGGGQRQSLYPGSGATEIYANGGDDVLAGDSSPVFGAFDDLLDGGGGNDVFIGGFGDDYLIGGSGDDYAFMTEGDMFLGGDGDDYAVGVADFWDSSGSTYRWWGALRRRWGG